MEQKGSLVDPHKLRFDFSHFEAISHDVLEKIESQVNEYLLQAQPVSTEYMSIAKAKAKGPWPSLVKNMAQKFGLYLSTM